MANIDNWAGQRWFEFSRAGRNYRYVLYADVPDRYEGVQWVKAPVDDKLGEASGMYWPAHGPAANREPWKLLLPAEQEVLAPPEFLELFGPRPSMANWRGWAKMSPFERAAAKFEWDRELKSFASSGWPRTPTAAENREIAETLKFFGPGVEVKSYLKKGFSQAAPYHGAFVVFRLPDDDRDEIGEGARELLYTGEAGGFLRNPGHMAVDYQLRLLHRGIQPTLTHPNLPEWV